MQSQADIHGFVETQVRPQPATYQVGKHAKKFVEDKQQRNIQRAVAQIVKMQYHQHAQRTVGERKGPVIGRYEQVLPHWR